MFCLRKGQNAGAWLLDLRQQRQAATGGDPGWHLGGRASSGSPTVGVLEASPCSAKSGCDKGAKGGHVSCCVVCLRQLLRCSAESAPVQQCVLQRQVPSLRPSRQNSNFARHCAADPAPIRPFPISHSIPAPRSPSCWPDEHLVAFVCRSLIIELSRECFLVGGGCTLLLADS